MRQLRRGDLVRVRRDEGDEWCRALVKLASGTSLLLTLADDAAVRAGDGFVLGILALSVDYQKRTATALSGELYEIQVAETHYDPLPDDDPLKDDAPELRGVPEGELRFWRLIEEREPNDGGETLTLACGHWVWVGGLPETQRYTPCGACRVAWDDAERALGERRQQDGEQGRK